MLANPHALFAASVLVAVGATDLRRTLLYVICLVLAVTVHEFAHAFAAHKLGDPTPEGQGRLTLNPVAHADPIGTLVLPITMGLFNTGLLFGWGRPVQTQPRYYTRRVSMRGGMALVAFAGPLSNLLMALLVLLGVWIAALAGAHPTWLVGRESPIPLFYMLNVALFAFNLLPLHPLDGGKVLGWLLPARYDYVDEFLLRYGGFILFALVFALPGVLGWLLSPFVDAGMWAYGHALSAGTSAVAGMR